MKHTRYIAGVAMLALFSTSCNDDIFDRTPLTQVGESMEIFESESGLETYANGFYSYFDPKTILDDFTSDNCEHISNPPAIRKAIYTLPTALGSGGWSWTQLRNINYFIAHCERSSVDPEIKARYVGLARFFRAKFYFEKVKSFGDVPWYSHVLDTDDEENLYMARTPRSVVMDSVLNDLDAAIKVLPETKYRNRISRWAALAYKSRICLYEGTWRKYHTEASLADAEKFLKASEEAARQVMESGLYSLYSTGKPESEYGDLFQAIEADISEVILARSAAPGKFFYYTPNFTSTSNGNYGVTASLVADYPMADGRLFSEAYPDADVRDRMPCYQEMADRDPRLLQTVIHPGYIRVGTSAIAVNDFAENRTGYQVIKRVGPPSEDQGGDTRDVILIRYAEVLLNYAEARAELGTLDQADVDLTVNVIRRRAGLPSRILPLVTDQTQRDMYRNVSDPNVLEIRRERRIELALEGFRKDDLIRWAEGERFRAVYKGIYISGMREFIDLDGNNKPDLYVLAPTDEMPAEKVDGVQYFRLSEVNGLSEGERGRLIPYNNTLKTFETWEYLKPIPTEELTLNPQLQQNAGWDKQ